MFFIFLLLHSFLAMYFLTLRVFVDCLRISIANFLTLFEIFHLPNVFLPSIDKNYVTEILFDKYYQIPKNPLNCSVIILTDINRRKKWFHPRSTCLTE